MLALPESDEEAPPAATRRAASAKLAAAAEALALAERIGPSADYQRADLLFQVGLARFRIAQAAGSPGGGGGATDAAATAARREQLKAAAEAMLRAAGEFRIACSEGAEAGPARAASQFAELAVRQLATMRRTKAP